MMTQSTMSVVLAWGLTDLGRRRRNNEDAWVADCRLRIAAVADGMGGEACGEVASEMTLQTLYSFIAQTTPGAPCDVVLRDAVREANARVRDEARKRNECRGMGSTVVAASWHKNGSFYLLNVGDSRCYLLRDGALRQLSYDQNLGNELRDSMGWSEEQVHRFPQRNVLTSAIGAADDVVMRELEMALLPYDLILLCSDGLYGPLGDANIAELLSRSSPGLGTLRRLIAAANDAGGPDNITAVLLAILPSPED
jgi:serine/threonine protein phosphatase PrpC